MCGINGFTWEDRDRIERMDAVTRHRGPDAHATSLSPEASLGFNRLAIIDLSPAGMQPMVSSDGRYRIVFNGEIYNYKELRAELEAKGRRFRSRSDTEVLLEAFAEWREAALPKLNGMFAFAIVDRERKELFLARDQIGVKPLYYAESAGRLVFSSEAKALFTHPEVSREIDIDALNLYLRFLYVPGPRTIWKGVRKLQPGHYAVWKGGVLTVTRYWAPTTGPTPRDRAEARARIRELAADAVRRQLMSDVPLGVFLSGGLDSSAVLGLMRETVPGDIKTFSIGFAPGMEEEEKYNADLRLAARTAAHFGTTHTPIVVSAKDVAACFEEIAWHMDEPVSNHIQPATYLLAKAARAEVTVALGGDGGDELFGGYDRYWYAAQLGLLDRLPMPLRSAPLLRLLAGAIGKRTLADKMAARPGLERFLSFMAQKEATVSRFLKAGVDRPGAASAAFAPYFAERWEDVPNQMMAADLRTWLPDESLVRSDKLTMASGLEQRVPLLDVRLAELAFRIPSSWKLGSRSQGKRILRDALADVIPPFLLQEKKRGFFSPAAKWLRGDLLPLARELLSPSYAPETAQYFDFDAIARILDDHVERRAYGLNTIWSLMTFQAWYRKCMR